MTYAEKLKDFRWLSFRSSFMQRCLAETEEGPLRCEDCGSEEGLQVHHKRYVDGRDPWDYDDEDLRLICRVCHEAIHTVEKDARALIISLPPHIMDEFEALLDAVKECYRDAGEGAVKVALAKAKNTVRCVTHTNNVPVSIHDILSFAELRAKYEE